MSREIFDWKKRVFDFKNMPEPSFKREPKEDIGPLSKKGEKARDSYLALQQLRQELIDSGEDLTIVPAGITPKDAQQNVSLIREIIKITRFSRFFPTPELRRLSFDSDNRFIISVEPVEIRRMVERGPIIESYNKFGFWYISKTSKGEESPREVTEELIPPLFGYQSYKDQEVKEDLTTEEIITTDQTAVRELGRLSKEQIFTKFEEIIKDQIK